MRDGDACTMNGGNNPGIYVTALLCGGSALTAGVITLNPPMDAKNGFQRWLSVTGSNISEAIEHPWEGIKGAAKGIANMPSHLSELLLRGAAEQQAAELEVAAAVQVVIGRTAEVKQMTEVATATRQGAAQIDLPKFIMSNPAQEGGDTISIAIQIVASGVGLAKAAVKWAAPAIDLATTARSVDVAAEKIVSLAASGGIADAGNSLAAIDRGSDGVRIAGAAEKNYGVTFFGDDILPYYNASKAEVGNPNGAPSFFMSLDDAALVRDAHDAVVYTGMAPPAQKAYLSQGNINGFSFPTDGLKVTKPTAADANGWDHFLEGGKTAVKLEGPNSGYMITPVREYVTPGNGPLPPGSVLFKVGPDGEWIPLRRW